MLIKTWVFYLKCLFVTTAVISIFHLWPQHLYLLCTLYSVHSDRGILVFVSQNFVFQLKFIYQFVWLVGCNLFDFNFFDSRSLACCLLKASSGMVSV